jgi:hypothetical protein
MREKDVASATVSTMAEVWIGTADLPDRVDRARYFQELQYLEASAFFAGQLKPGTLHKWIATTPKGAIGLVAPWVLTYRKPPATTKYGSVRSPSSAGRPSQPTAATWGHDPTVGDFRNSAPGRVALAELRSAAVQLEARCAVFRSPPAFAPSVANRDQLRRFFNEVATVDMVGASRVWVPDGLWEPRVAAKLATEIGVTIALDPLVREPGSSPRTYEDLEVSSLYLRIEGLGRSGPLRSERLEDLVMLLEHYASIPVTVVFASSTRWQDARNLKKLL